MQGVLHNMCITYKVILNPEEKKTIKSEFQNFFYSIYNRELNNTDWEHQFIHSPYNDSPLFIAQDNEKIIGSALMIAQRFTDGTNDGNYYLWTTSAIDKNYRSRGIYAELLAKQREYATETDKSFIFAFPNKLAYPVVKLFGGFKDLQKSNLVKTTLNNLDFSKISNSLSIDKPFFQWRFEHKDYLFFNYEENILIGKKYENILDILAIYPKETFKELDINYQEVLSSQTIITLELFLENIQDTEVLDTLNGTYFPIDKTVNFDNITINLLMSDVF